MANLALEQGREARARPLYEEALSAASELLDAAALAGHPQAALVAPALFGISCNDIAELARRQGDVETEGIFRYRLVERFIEVTTSPRAPLTLRSRCLLHLRVASEALYRYFEARGMWEAAQAYSERANAAMFEVQRAEAAALAAGAPAHEAPRPPRESR